MLQLRSQLFAALALAALSTTTYAGMQFAATLTGSQENPPNNSSASGNATFFLNDAQTKLSFYGTIKGLDFTGTQSADLTDNLTNAHIHAPAPVGTNAGVVWGFIGSPFNDTVPNVVVTPFATGVGATFSGAWDAGEGNNTTLEAQIANIVAGLSYMNFHTAALPGGAIRGQIVPIPEPSTTALLALGGLGLIGFMRRRLTRPS